MIDVDDEREDESYSLPSLLQSSFRHVDPLLFPVLWNFGCFCSVAICHDPIHLLVRPNTDEIFGEFELEQQFGAHLAEDRDHDPSNGLRAHTDACLAVLLASP